MQEQAEFAREGSFRAHIGRAGEVLQLLPGCCGLVPLPLDAAMDASPGRERDIVHALRVAGHLRG